MKETFRDTLWSIAKGAGLAAGGAFLSYVSTWAAGHQTDLIGLILGGLASVGLNALRKFGGQALASLASKL
jgi:hypothetical protein